MIALIQIMGRFSKTINVRSWIRMAPNDSIANITIQKTKGKVMNS